MNRIVRCAEKPMRSRASSMALRMSATPEADRGDLGEVRLGDARDDAREARLARAGGPVQDHRRELVLLDGAAERGPGSDHVGLPDELVEGARSHARGERRSLAYGILGALREQVVHSATAWL